MSSPASRPRDHPPPPPDPRPIRALCQTRAQWPRGLEWQTKAGADRRTPLLPSPLGALPDEARLAGRDSAETTPRLLKGDARALPSLPRLVLPCPVQPLLCLVRDLGGRPTTTHEKRGAGPGVAAPGQRIDSSQSSSGGGDRPPPQNPPPRRGRRLQWNTRPLPPPLHLAPVHRGEGREGARILGHPHSATCALRRADPRPSPRDEQDGGSAFGYDARFTADSQPHDSAVLGGLLPSF